VHLCFLIRWNVCLRFAARIAVCTMTGISGGPEMYNISLLSYLSVSLVFHILSCVNILETSSMNLTCGMPFCVIIYSSCKLLKMVLWPTLYVVQCIEYFVTHVVAILNDYWIGISNYLSQGRSKLLMAIFFVPVWVFCFQKWHRRLLDSDVSVEWSVWRDFV